MQKKIIHDFVMKKWEENHKEQYSQLQECETPLYFWNTEYSFTNKKRKKECIQ